jgi:hypothetical protein
VRAGVVEVQVLEQGATLEVWQPGDVGDVGDVEVQDIEDCSLNPCNRVL